MADFEKCPDCGSDEIFIQIVWQGRMSQRAGMVYCNRCYRYVPLRIGYGFDQQDVSDTAIKVWNDAVHKTLEARNDRG